MSGVTRTQPTRRRHDSEVCGKLAAVFVKGDKVATCTDYVI
jgi:hypothetical protein